MIPVDQLIVPDRFDAVYHGDCMRAVIASILELPADAVPHCYDYDARTCADGSLAVARLQAWLGPRGLGYLELFVVEEHYAEFAAHYLRGHHVMVGLAGVAEHAVVGYQGACVHDPHPRRTGVLPHSPVGAGGVLGYTVGVLYLLGGEASHGSESGEPKQLYGEI